MTTQQLTLDDVLSAVTKGRDYFDGRTYDPRLDSARLTAGLMRVAIFLSDQKWHTTEEINQACHLSAGDSRARDLRKPKFGGFHVPSRRIPNTNLWEYCLDLDRKIKD